MSKNVKDKDFDKVCKILRFKYNWNNPDCIEALDDIIKATKQVVKGSIKS